MQITRYNESSVDARAIHLTNQLDTVTPVVGVQFSHPSGTIRLNGFAQFTHFVTSFEGTSYVYKITGFTAVNNTVCDYTYTLDYLKDYFYKNGDLAFANSGVFCTRSTVESQWDKYVDDPQYTFLTGGQSVNKFSTGDESIAGSIIVKLNRPSPITSSTCPYYLLKLSSFDDYKNLVKHISTPEEDSDEYKMAVIAANQIGAIYYVPFLSPGGNSDKITFICDESYKGGSFAFTDVGGTIISDMSLITVSKIVDFGTTLDYKRIYYTDYSISIPCFGTVKIPLERFINYANGSTKVCYSIKINILDGIMMLNLGYFKGTANDWDIDDGLVGSIATSAIPMLPIPSASGASTKLNSDYSYNSSLISTAISTTAKAVTGNFAALGSDATNLMQAQYAHNIGYEKAQMANLYDYTSVGGFNGILQPKTYIIAISYNVTIHPEIYGYIVNKSFQYDLTFLIPDNKYWFDTSEATFGGYTAEYVSRLKSELNSGYIYYNAAG